MRTDLGTLMKHGAALGDGRFRSAKTIAVRSGYSLRTVQALLPSMERRGEVEVKRGVGRVKKVYRRAR